MTNPVDRREVLRRALGLGLFIGASDAPAALSTDWLVSPDEVARLAEQALTPLWLPKSPGAPQIDVIRPALAGDALASPLPIELAFRAGADAAIDAASFRVFYGALQLDVTQRLLKSVVVRPDGLTVEQAAIPPGSHRLVLQVADTRQRVATRELRFAVR